MLTARQATDIDLGRDGPVPQSHVKEIRTIQQSLRRCKSRLKLKQTSRKKRIDELVHRRGRRLRSSERIWKASGTASSGLRRREVRTCEAQIEHLSSIITNVSGLLDAETDAADVKIETVEVSELIRQIVDGLKAQFDRKQIQLRVSGHGKIAIQTDRYKLSQALYNLVTNAYKFTPPGGSVTIAYELLEGGLMVSVQDTGSGISKEDQPRIFEAYYRGGNSLSSEGDGFGLYVAKENLEKIGGNDRAGIKAGSREQIYASNPERRRKRPAQRRIKRIFTPP